MKRTAGIAFKSLLITLALSPASKANAGPQKPQRSIEVFSDPYGVGNPTVYSIIRGTSKVTFSHPIMGQFSRAEISTREKNGTKLTRFHLSPNRKNYVPTLQMLTPFETHYSKTEAVCPDPKPPTNFEVVSVLKDKVDEARLIAQKRKELEQAEFFDKSCYGKNVSQKHRDALFNGTADVLTVATQNTRPDPKFLQCLENNSFGAESGAIQAFVNQSIRETKLNHRIKIGCVVDEAAEPAAFNEQSKMIWIKVSPLSNRESFAGKVFHELLHVVPLRDGPVIQAMEDCCTAGENCNVLNLYAAQTKCGVKTTTVLETINPAFSTLSGQATVLQGSGADALACKTAGITSEYERSSIAEKNPTKDCGLLGNILCKQQTHELSNSYANEIQCRAQIGKIEYRTPLLGYLLEYSYADSDCGAQDLLTATIKYSVLKELAASEKQTVAELAEKFPQTSPVSWPEVETKVPVKLASYEEPRKAPPVRSIASIAPLPEENPQQQLGSSRNREDVQGGRATVLVDTLERAARTVTRYVTPEKIELLKVDPKEIFKANFKPKTKNPQYMVASLDAASIKVADIGDIKNVGFANPFATTVNLTGGGGKAQRNLASDSPSVENDFSAKSNRKSRVETDPAQSTNSDRNYAPVKSAAFASGNASVTNGSATGSAPKRAPSSQKPDFKTMNGNELVKFLTSSYRSVERFIGTEEFIEAIAKNRIQVIDHERQKIGALKPDLRFEYDEKLQRLVLKRRERK